MLLFSSTDPSGTDIDLKTPLVVWDGLTLGSYKDEREEDLLLQVPEVVMTQNGSWWMDVMLLKGGGTEIAGKGPGDAVAYRKCEFHKIR